MEQLKLEQLKLEQLKLKQLTLKQLTLKQLTLKQLKLIEKTIRKSVLLILTLILSIGCINNIAYAYSPEEAIELYEEWDNELKEYTRDICKENDVSESIVLAIIYNESRFQEDVTGYNTNGTKDYGLMQLNDVTYDFLSRKIGIESMEELYDAKTNILAGVTIFKYHKDRVGNEEDALLCYQIGEGTYYSMKRSGKSPNQTYYNVLNVSKKIEDFLLLSSISYIVISIANCIP